MGNGLCSACRSPIASTGADYSDTGQPLCSACSGQQAYERAHAQNNEERIQSEHLWLWLPPLALGAGMLIPMSMGADGWGLLLSGTICFAVASAAIAGVVGQDTLDRAVASGGRKNLTLIVRPIAKLARRYLWRGSIP